MPTTFSKFAELCRKLESTTKRTEKIAYLVDFLAGLDRGEVAPAVSFTTGRPFPESDERVLDVGGQTVWKVHRNSGQSALIQTPVTLLEVYRTFEEIAHASGSGSRQRKETLLDTLLTRLSPEEQDYLMRIVFGEMRIGAVEGVVLDAIAEASSINLDKVRRANMLLGSLPKVAELVLTKGREGIDAVGLTLFVPIKPMLAEMADGFDEVLKEHGGRSAFEFKYDGARIQIHRKNGEVRIFSRRLTEVTASIPDIVELARTRINASEYLVEGEVVATGRDGRPLPFQDLMRRFRRVHEIDAMVNDIPLKLYLFDIVYLDGHLLIDEPYEKRWATLSGLTENDLLATRIVTGDVAEAKRLMDASINAGHEGLMAKDLKSTYTPGVRGKKWFKIKPAETLDVVIVAADWGSGRRRGWLSNYHLGVRDEETGEFLVVGKTFKGLTDQEFTEITPKLLELKTRETDYTVYVKPSIVVEVAFNEIQHSPHYKSGFALRFARITRFRTDKRPEDADSLQR
ncbi:MAG TPA: ATP-dependent DNA ligase [Candidatus Acidoferrales bacterium]|nr:ATP-dependent DNA ligase [Candidatus Acidoferrales bacterium]